MNSNLDSIRNRIAAKHIALTTEKAEKAMEPRIVYPKDWIIRKPFVDITQTIPQRALTLV